MTMNDALNGRQPDPGAFKFVSPVKALEYAEQLVYVFHIETDAVVSDIYYIGAHN